LAYCEPLDISVESETPGTVPDRAKWYGIGPAYGGNMGLLRRLPVMKLLAIGEVALLARSHVRRLEPHERRRLVALVRKGRSLSPAEREELGALVAKAEPRRFAGLVADKLSPVPLPRRLVEGRRH
jgi:hypothetical protein